MLWACIKYRNQVDLVLIDTYSTLNFYYALGVAMMCSILQLPYVCILHGGNLESRLQHSKFLSEIIFKNAKELVAPSHFLKSVFEEYGYPEVHYIPNTINIENYPFKHRKQLTPKLLWVRSFSQIYNPKMAVDVTLALIKLKEKPALCMVGPEKDGSKAATEAYAKQNQLNVNFTGKLSKREWAQLATEYDVFINTTNVDNMPVSVIEAMALGLPVVSTNVGGIPFLLSDKEDAFLVEPEDSVAMAQAIKELLESPEAVERITENARLKAASFDWEIVKNKWLKVLENDA